MLHFQAYPGSRLVPHTTAGAKQAQRLTVWHVLVQLDLKEHISLASFPAEQVESLQQQQYQKVCKVQSAASRREASAVAAFALQAAAAAGGSGCCCSLLLLLLACSIVVGPVRTPHLDDQVAVVMGDRGVTANQCVTAGTSWQQAELHVISQVDYLHVVSNACCA